MTFENYHPGILFLYFASVIVFTICFQHPVFLTISFLTSFLYAFVLRKRKNRNVWHLPAYLLLTIFTAIYYIDGHHFGSRKTGFTFRGNSITLDAAVYGMVLGIILVSVLSWMNCVYCVFTSDKIIYLFGRISPKASLYLSLLFRMLPCIKDRWKKTREAQHNIGRDISQGTVLERIHHMNQILSSVTTWTFEYMKESADSMKSRGYSLKKRTAFSIYRFQNADRTFVVWLFFLYTILGVGALLDQNTACYNPEMLFNRITPFSFLFYAAYCILCLLPLFNLIMLRISLIIHKNVHDSGYRTLQNMHK